MKNVVKTIDIAKWIVNNSQVNYSQNVQFLARKCSLLAITTLRKLVTRPTETWPFFLDLPHVTIKSNN